MNDQYDPQLTTKEGVYLEPDTFDPAILYWARILGYGGLIPFFISALLMLVLNGEYHALASKALLSYAAVIITFVGALHWSRALLDRNCEAPVALLIISVLPSLIAWAALLIETPVAFILLITSFIIMLAIDRRQWKQISWFYQLRLHLSLGAISSLLIGLIAY